MTKKDNAGFVRKRQLRVNLLRELHKPLVMETHAGGGKLWRHCYREVPFGIAIDKNEGKAALLGRARPTWAVYETDSERALGEGLASMWPVNFLDVDPWGDPWPTLGGFFTSKRERPQELVVVVTDGLRQAAKMGIGWKIPALRRKVEQRGNAALHDEYLQVCEEMLGELAKLAGYTVRKWTGYHTGHAGQMSHYGAVLAR